MGMEARIDENTYDGKLRTYMLLDMADVLDEAIGRPHDEIVRMSRDMFAIRYGRAIGYYKWNNFHKRWFIEDWAIREKI